MKYFIGNWKQNILPDDLGVWTEFFEKYSQNPSVIVAPQSPLLPLIREKSTIRLAGQDVSPFTNGAHTGRISPDLLRLYATYCIVGHSEMRKEAAESNDLVMFKTKRLLENGITPIICLDLPYIDTQLDLLKKEFIDFSKVIFAYEPLASIGTGKPATPAFADQIALKIKSKSLRSVPVVYGGSIDPENIKEFSDNEYITGFLIGKASLSPQTFATIIDNA
jgi:triosephosphate isomerase (TIM)